MLGGRKTIVQRYLEQAKSDPFEPGNCSFCGERPVVAWFEARASRRSFEAQPRLEPKRRGCPARRVSHSSRGTTATVSPGERDS
jgi:hypothetical protein